MNNPRTPTIPSVPLIHHQPLSFNYLTKRSPKYFHCNITHFQPPNSPMKKKQIPNALKHAKYLQKLEKLQSIVPYHQYTWLVKRHGQGIETSQALQSLQTKSAGINKHISQHLKNVRRFEMKANLMSCICVKFTNSLRILSISIQSGSEPLYQNYMIKTLSVIGKRFTRLEKLSISSGEDPKSQVVLLQVLGIARRMPSIRDIQVKFQQAIAISCVFLPSIDFEEVSRPLISSIQWPRHPVCLLNVLKNSESFTNLRDLSFRMPLEADNRLKMFDIRALKSIGLFQNLQNLKIIMDLCMDNNDFFIEQLRFPASLKKLSLGLEHLDYQRILEGKSQQLQEFCENFARLELEELNLSMSVNQYYITYCDFIRKLLRSQKTLKNLNLKYSYTSFIYKVQEKRYLHIADIFSDIEMLESLASFESSFEIIDFSQKMLIKSITHKNLAKVSLNISEARWQDTPTRGFSEEILRRLAKCENLKELLMQSRCTKEVEDIRKALNVLKMMAKLERVQIAWNVDSLEIEGLCAFLEGVKKPMDVYFGLKQVLITKNELDAIVKSVRKNRALMEVKISGLQCDVLKHGLDGAPYIYGWNPSGNFC